MFANQSPSAKPTPPNGLWLFAGSAIKSGHGACLIFDRGDKTARYRLKTGGFAAGISNLSALLELALNLLLTCRRYEDENPHP